MRYIDKIGVELEGGWEEKPEGLRPDASVYISNSNYVGEISSIPFGNIKELRKWLFKNYPKKVNNTCGLHIHISLKNVLLYSKVMTKEFHKYVKNSIIDFINVTKLDAEDKDNLIKRIKGCNRFCGDSFRADEQVIQEYKETCRYTHINYCFSLHGTIEFRILCMFKSKHNALKFIKVIIKCVNEYLKKVVKEKEELVVQNVFEEDKNEKIIIEEMV